MWEREDKTHDLNLHLFPSKLFLVFCLAPTKIPTETPTPDPTGTPTGQPTTDDPTKAPTKKPTKYPTFSTAAPGKSLFTNYISMLYDFK